MELDKNIQDGDWAETFGQELFGEFPKLVYGERVFESSSCRLVEDHNYSHSIVAGGLLEMSRQTRLTPLTSLVMREAMRSRIS